MPQPKRNVPSPGTRIKIVTPNEDYEAAQNQVLERAINRLAAGGWRLAEAEKTEVPLRRQHVDLSPASRAVARYLANIPDACRLLRERCYGKHGQRLIADKAHR
jgi:hypothetical protein